MIGTEATPTLRLRPYQEDFVRAIREQFESVNATLAVSPVGCHRAGQRVLLWNGQRRYVELIEPGDWLMGPDSLPRVVVSLCRGRGRMVRIVPTKGKSWVVNEDHVLTLVRTAHRSVPKYKSEAGGELVDVTVREWMKWSRWKKHMHKLVRFPVDFCLPQTLRVQPYMVGVLLGDGSVGQGSVGVTTADREIEEEVERFASGINYDVSRVKAGGISQTLLMTHYAGKRGGGCKGGRLGNLLKAIGIRGCRSHSKFIPFAYRTSSRLDRLELLAGLIDTDGSYTCSGYDFISKSPRLADDVAFIARSVGLAAYVKECQKASQNGTVGTYHRVSISGDVSIIPCRVERKKASPRRQKKSVLRTSFTVEPLGEEDYYGFTLTDDGRYLLDDFTVTHNTGKTVLFASLARDWPSGRVLVMAHRDELIRQAADKIENLCGEEPAIEMGDERSDELSIFGRRRVVVTSVQTMCRPNRLDRFNPHDFGLLIADEAHHAIADTWQRVINHYRQNPSLKVLGVTATPDRSDEMALGQVFESVAKNYELHHAIDDGWLVPIDQQFVFCDGIDFSAVRTTAGDLNGGDLESVMSEERVLHQVVHPTIELAGDVTTLVFASSVAHADRMAEIFNRHSQGSAICLHGGTPIDERRRQLQRFKHGEFQFLCSCGLFLEGFDEPRIGCIAMARPTKSRSLYCQAVGRGTRPLSGTVDGLETAEERKERIALSGKSSCLVLDFVGNSGRHKLISTADILDGEYPDDVVESAREEAKRKSKRGERSDMMAELAEARRRAEEEGRRKRRHLVARARYGREQVNPFDVFDIMPKREPGWFKGKQPTEKQLAILRNAGMPTKDISFAQASQLIGEVFKRRESGQATFRQAQILARFGERTDVSFTEASSMIDEIKARGWKPRSEVEQ